MPYKDKSKYKSDAYREYMRNYQRSWHQRNRARRIAKVYERKERLWEFYNELKSTLECAQCGENHPATLQFHHRDPQKKDFNLSESVREGYSIERINKHDVTNGSGSLLMLRDSFKQSFYLYLRGIMGVGLLTGSILPSVFLQKAHGRDTKRGFALCRRSHSQRPCRSHVKTTADMLYSLYE